MTRMTKRLFPVAAAALLLTSQTAAACDYPERPDIPDGNTASKEEMLAASASVKEYIANVDEFLVCIEDEETAAIAALGDEADDEEIARRSAMLDKRFDAANEEKALVGEMFNQQVRAFNEKARSAQN